TLDGKVARTLVVAQVLTVIDPALAALAGEYETRLGLALPEDLTASIHLVPGPGAEELASRSDDALQALRAARAELAATHRPPVPRPGPNDPAEDDVPWAADHPDGPAAADERLAALSAPR